jgi:EpsI family protein
MTENQTQQKTFWKSYTVAFCLIIVSGVAFHYLYAAFNTEGVTVVLEKPLATFPKTIGDWDSNELPISDAVLKVANNDDYVSRSYYNTKTRQAVNLYIAYTKTPRAMHGHRPDICYKGNGWENDFTNETTITSSDGTIIPCLLHRFYKTGLNASEIYVLNYYVVNGQLTNEEKDFSGLRWQIPKDRLGKSNFVTQVQINAVSERSVRDFATAIGDLVLDHMPKKDTGDTVTEQAP